MRRNSPR